MVSTHLQVARHFGFLHDGQMTERRGFMKRAGDAVRADLDRGKGEPQASNTPSRPHVPSTAVESADVLILVPPSAEPRPMSKREAIRAGRLLLGIRLHDDRIESRWGSGPLAGAHASVETQGDIERRITATRLVLTGPLALAFRKKKDHRELQILIEGRGFAIIRPVPKIMERKARQFAANVNAETAKATALEAASQASGTAPEPSHLDRLEQLVRLRDSGALTDAEFDAEKVKLLASRSGA
jgi:hypothetical protein